MNHHNFNDCKKNIGIRFKTIKISNRDYIWEYRVENSLVHNPFLDRRHRNLTKENYEFGDYDAQKRDKKRTFINTLWRLKPAAQPNLEEITTWDKSSGQTSIHKFEWTKPSSSKFAYVKSCDL